jgi:hypothetical protein
LPPACKRAPDDARPTGCCLLAGALPGGRFDDADEARRRIHSRAGADGIATEDIVEHPALQDRQSPRNADAAAAGADAREVARLPRQAHHFVEHPEAAQRMVGVRNEPVAAHLVARKRLAVDQDGRRSGARASVAAAALPAGPAPTTRTSHAAGKALRSRFIAAVPVAGRPWRTLT